MEVMETKKVEANKANIELAIASIVEYTKNKNYRIIGEFKKEGFITNLLSSSKLSFNSKSQEKVLRNYLTHLQERVGMSLANRFLHFLYKKVYKINEVPRIDYSEKELKIKAAQKIWKQNLKAMKESRELYKLEKGDFYKNKN